MKFLKTQVIVNPESDKGKTRRRWKEIKEAIKSFIHDFKVEFTEKPFQATEITRSAVKSGAELVIGVGGDGTINEIANGFFEERRIINSDSALGILPSGTGCDLTKSLKIPRGFKEALKVITQAPSTLIDIGRVTFRNRDGGESERMFVNVADFGLGGEVVSEVNQRRLERKASSYMVGKSFSALTSPTLKYPCGGPRRWKPCPQMSKTSSLSSTASSLACCQPLLKFSPAVFLSRATFRRQTIFFSPGFSGCSDDNRDRW